MDITETLLALILNPREKLDIEYKDWLNLGDGRHKAKIAKSIIALANQGGGFLVIGFREIRENLLPQERPNDLAVIDQDGINAIVRRYISPTFHCELHMAAHPDTGTEYPIVIVPGPHPVPVMSIRAYDGELRQHTCYMRKPGPLSEPPRTADEWRTIFDQCLRAGRDDLLDAFRSIMAGSVATPDIDADHMQQLSDFCLQSDDRWRELTDELPAGHVAQFPLGSYELAFSLLDAEPVATLPMLNGHLDHARGVNLSGWSPFLKQTDRQAAPRVFNGNVEAWVGGGQNERLEMFNQPAYKDYWNVSPNNLLYTKRGYHEDSIRDIEVGTIIDIVKPIKVVAEGLLFASRYAGSIGYEGSIAIIVGFTGLRGRRLSSINIARPIYEDRIAEQNEWRGETVIELADIENNLPEVLHSFLSSFYELFDFFPLSLALVREAVEELLNRR
ncbi:putative DNA binding domain-containing protein [Kordiimonas sp. SCSIO 12603]|uniref:AlbA family DNA-binding domain-containing protein n=1 Tax=Kordiimonas sp. SCSIO 12603 TaxID=2829596 RepID=UPI0021072893|nr:ATP-binding protein [Kordiimonas sp. SCSIO 12603]UTW59664.1 putative DNA binding domain-containing protein [Kordiimonas sp. SCSIO 12603]